MTDDPATSPVPQRPLVVDLDGTLVTTDTMLEAVLRLLRRRPWMGLVLAWWLRDGVVPFKRRMLGAHMVDPAKLPWREDVLGYVRAQRDAGRRIVLATASNIAVAQTVAAHLRCFDFVIGTDREENLRGEAKVRAIRELLQVHEYDYIGDSRWDLAVWREATEALLVSPTIPVEREARSRGNVVRVFRLEDEPYTLPRMVWRSVRPVGMAIVAAGPLVGRWLGVAPIPWVSAAMFAVGGAGLWACLSIVRDLLCVESDRAHPRGRLRPIAAGHWPLLSALQTCGALAALALIVLATAAAIAWRAAP